LTVSVAVAELLLVPVAVLTRLTVSVAVAELLLVPVAVRGALVVLVAVPVLELEPVAVSSTTTIIGIKVVTLRPLIGNGILTAAADGALVVPCCVQ
jgi:hypothetical protein